VHEFVGAAHVAYVVKLSREDGLEAAVTEHLRMSGVYWGCSAVELLRQLDAMQPDAIVDFVLSCQNCDGGFGGAVGHDSHMLYTLSAVQLLALCGGLGRLPVDPVVAYVTSLQQVRKCVCVCV
jgi:geranylgeranyl transferase type-2 subunit beta